MIDPPSQQLIDRISALGLCTPGDFSRCRPLVKKLARDLPTFDIIWLDALVQKRLLTTFQANSLAETSTRLKIGPYLLVDELHVEHDISVFKARTDDHKTVASLSVIQCTDNEREKIVARLNEKISNFSVVKSPSLILPHACQIDGSEIVVVEPFIEGPTLAELMNRRGRFEPGVVLDIAGQLLTALSQLQETGETHGDFRLANVVLTKKGNAVLTHCGIRAAMRPEMTVHSPFPADCHNAVAPETIGIQKFRTPASDLYGLGCLLWHLLAGRPPFISADPLEKLVRHQTESVGDISDWNPEAPAKLVTLVNHLTRSDPNERPQSAEEALAIIKKPGRRAQRRLVDFHNKFRISVPGNRHAFQFNSSYALATCVLLFAMLGIAFTEPNSRAVLLDIASHVKQLPLGSDSNDPDNKNNVSTDDDGPNQPVDTNHTGTWSIPNQEGVIAFTTTQPVVAEPVVQSGKLTIRSDEQRPVVVQIRGDQPWRLTADEIELENLIIELAGTQKISEDAKSAALEAMVVLQAQNVSMRNCTFRINSKSGNNVRSTIAWKAENANDALGGTASFENTVFANTGTAIVLGHSFGTIASINTLKTGPGAFLELRKPIVPQRGLSVQLHQTTIREANALIHFSQTASNELLGQLEIIATSSVFDLISNRSGLLFFNESIKPPVIAQSVRLSGRESLLNSGTPIVATPDVKSRKIQPIEVPDMLLEGIISTSIEFSSQSTTGPEDSEVIQFQGPRLSAELPGYRYSRQ